MGDVSLNSDLHLLVLAFANERTAGEIPGPLFDAAIDGWMLGRISVISDDDDLPDVGFLH